MVESFGLDKNGFIEYEIFVMKCQHRAFLMFTQKSEQNIPPIKKQ